MKTICFDFENVKHFSCKDGKLFCEVPAESFKYLPDDLDIDDTAELLFNEDISDLQDIFCVLQKKLKKYGTKFTFTFKYEELKNNDK